MPAKNSLLLTRVEALFRRALTKKEAAEAAARQAEEAIVDARRQGCSLQEIADAAGLSRQRVHQIVSKIDGADGAATGD